MPHSDTFTDELPAFSRMIAEALGDRLVAGESGFADMMAADGVMEFPFAAPGMPDALRGRDAIAAHVAWLSGILVLDRFSAPTVHASDATDTVVLEFECEGAVKAGGAPYDQRFVSVITLHEGRIARYRDYWNPLVVLASMPGDADAPVPAAGVDR